jgi:hypothetical protein
MTLDSSCSAIEAADFALESFQSSGHPGKLLDPQYVKWSGTRGRRAGFLICRVRVPGRNGPICG